MSANLERYLNDHLAGSSGAVVMIQSIADSQDTEEARSFFTDLKEKVEKDRELLDKLMQKAGMEPSTPLKAVGNVAGRLGMLKMMWEGFEPGKLGMFEALEALALGVQGKRLLWTTLGRISGQFPEWNGYDFAALEREAIEQRDGVERWRLQAGLESLTA